MRFILFTFFLFVGINHAEAGAKADTSSLVVKTEQGALMGVTKGKVNVFKGIPYAQAPVGNLRFKLPQPPLSWEGIRPAQEFGSPATQLKGFRNNLNPGSEDCLYLNVWAPKNNSTLKPVMFWIHGGAFMMGTGSHQLYEGTNLSQNGDVVVVTINYRLGPFGFLHLNEYNDATNEFASNAGLHDQLAALKWVKQNIAAFGGDPDNVTIFGESAGAVSVLALLSSPLTKGYFHKAIIESATVEALHTKDAMTAITKDFLSYLNIASDSVSKLLDYSTQELKEAADNYLATKTTRTRDILYFLPVIGDDFLPIDPEVAIQSGFAGEIPIIIGTNRDEANLFARSKPPVIEPVEETVHKFLSRKGLEGYSTQVTQMYDNYPSRKSILLLATDALFQMPSIQIAESQSNFNTAFSYRFDWTSLPIRMIGLGACHGLELPFVFNSFEAGAGKKLMRASPNRKVKRLSTHMQTAWVNFARTGNPATEKRAWQQYDAQNRFTMIFDNRTRVVSDPSASRRKGWSDIIKTARGGKTSSL